MVEEINNEDKANTAVVCWFDGKKGFGYLTRDDGEGDIFVHWSNLSGMEGFKTLKPGQVVSFEFGENHKGQQAENVVVLSEPEEDQDQRETEE